MTGGLGRDLQIQIYSTFVSVAGKKMMRELFKKGHHKERIMKTLCQTGER
jgi:hypothetical protein